jgi:hypothetical protein
MGAKTATLIIDYKCCELLKLFSGLAYSAPVVPKLREQKTGSTNNVPQCDNIIVARGRQAEGSRFAAASAVVVGIKGFNMVLPNGKTLKRRNGSFCFRTLSGKNSLRP